MFRNSYGYNQFVLNFILSKPSMHYKCMPFCILCKTNVAGCLGINRLYATAFTFHDIISIVLLRFQVFKNISLCFIRKNSERSSMLSSLRWVPHLKQRVCIISLKFCFVHVVRLIASFQIIFLGCHFYCSFFSFIFNSCVGFVTNDK